MTNPLAFLKTDGDVPDGHVMDPHDSGWRKYFLTFFAVACLSAGAIATHYFGAKDFLEVYKTFGSYLVDIVGIYIIGNVGYKVGAGVVNAKVAKPAEKNAKADDES